MPGASAPVGRGSSNGTAKRFVLAVTIFGVALVFADLEDLPTLRPHPSPNGVVAAPSPRMTTPERSDASNLVVVNGESRTRTQTSTVGEGASSALSESAQLVTTPVTGSSPSQSPSVPPAATTSTTTTLAPNTLTQVLAVRIAGSTISIAPAAETVTVSRVGSTDSFIGVLPTVTVIDARGTLAGWIAMVAPTSLPPGAQLLIEPGPPTVVSGNEGEVQQAGVGVATPASAAMLMWAPAQGGGGTFDVDASIECTEPGASGDAVRISLTFSAV